MSRAIFKKKQHVGIRAKLVASLVIFTMLVLVSIWVLQIKLLAYFYERAKFDELNDAYGSILEHFGDDDFEAQLEAVAQKKGICVRVFSVGNGVGRELASAEAGSDCMIHHISKEIISNLYARAKANGGKYDKRMEFSGQISEGEREDFYFPGLHRPTDVTSAICVRLLSVDGAEYCLLLDSELTPVSATVNTLKVQFLWTAVLLLFAATLFALLLYRIIATPLTAITEKARKLAAGNYEADFEGHGYREVEELAETLNFAAREIGATDHLQKELIANISHDLRTPLTMIKGYSEVMRDLPGENNAENAQIIIDETSRLSELVSDLLDLSKLRAGTKKPELEVLDISALTSEVMKRYEALVKHNGYTILFESEGEARVLADRTMILQVIYNLINNAINYTGDSLRVRVSLTKQSGVMRLSVADEGEGIAPDAIKHIWDRYYRVDKVHNRAVIGTGLGLSIVKSVLEAHGAAYGVDSALGVGSIFWLELPLVDDAPPKN